jgi:HAD superfamily hydrolase (TIGR01490 family)
MSIAFFDIDGTLLRKPSLERRFFWDLQRRGEIPIENCLHWIAESLFLGLRGARAAIEGNKTYLRGLSSQILAQCKFQTRAPWLPEFFPAAVQQVWWHALRGDSIVLVSGTLAPLAEIVKFALERELLWRGVETKISVLATQLEVGAGRCTGRVAGAAMFGEEKARAARAFAQERNISLAQCSAYGDSSLDRWMLASVGHPFAVNPTRRLRRTAKLRGWQMLAWTHCPMRTAGERRALQLKDEAAR